MGIKIQFAEEVTFAQMGEAFVNAHSREQQEFLEQLVYGIFGYASASGWWPQQCRAITDETWQPENRRRLICALEILIDHLREPSESPKA